MRKLSYKLFFSCAVLTLCSSLAMAGEFPDRPVRIIVPFPPGAATDATMRAVALKLASEWKQPVIIDNKAGLTTGTIAAAAAAPDGYTLLLGTSATMVTTPMTMAKPTYVVARDFVPVGRMVTLAPVLVTHPSTGVKSLKELIAAAKSRPGELNFASSGVGTPGHLVMEQLQSMTGIRMLHVPYKGGAPIVSDLVGGQVQFAMNALPSVLEFIKTGKLVAVAVGQKERAKALPQVPTISETVPGFDFTIWYGLFAPAKTPPEVVTRIGRDLRLALGDADVARKLQAQGSDPAPSTPQELLQLMRKETEQWQKIIRDRNLQIQ
jgi:tripartite-type tricarboxylate transporter receptor subunit TctC